MLKNKYTISIATFINFLSPFALAWSFFNLFFAQYVPALLTIGYIILSYISLYLYDNDKRQHILVRLQILMLMLIPLVLAIYYGGFEHNLNIILWSFFGPVIALLYTDSNEAQRWLKLFILLVVVGSFIHPLGHQLPYSETTTKLFSLANMIAVLVGIYLLLRFYIKKTESTVSDNTSFLQSYINSIDNNLIVTRTNPHGFITYANDNFYNLTKFLPHEVIGKHYSSFRAPDVAKSVEEDIWHTISQKNTWQGVLKNVKKDGSFYWVDATTSPIFNKDGNVVEFITIRYDITELIQKQEELHNLLITDTLTGLRSRKALFDDKNEPETHHSLVLINLDHFSQINNLYGEGFGDKVLRSFASSLDTMAQQKQKCRVYRLGGDEFVILSYETHKQVIVENVQNLISFFQHTPLVIDNQQVSISLSIGISFETNSELLETASMALKIARRDNKEYVIYSQNNSLSLEYANNLVWAREIKDAIENDRIVTYFQAIKENETDAIHKYETLVRLVRKDGSIATPFEFLDIAKRSKLYKQITKIVITKSFEYFKDKEESFSVNITIEDILDKGIRQFIFDTLEKYRLDSRVVFEIVENEHIEKFEVIDEFINKVKSYGAKISIDDFGTGYSNFEYLMKLQADFIKIDGSIIKNIMHDKKSELITSIIVSFAQEMNIKTIGEFVENEEIDNKLKELGVDHSQGYFISKPQENL